MKKAKNIYNFNFEKLKHENSSIYLTYTTYEICTISNG